MSPLIWRVEHVEEIESTNTALVAAARNGAPEGSVLLTGFQSRGRGRLDRQWDAPPYSSLLASILLRPSLDATSWQLCVAAVALSTRAALVRLSGVRPDLKWPNDLVVRERKLAGVLAEVVLEDAVPAIVVGVGVNLTYEGPTGVEGTSVRAESGITLEPRALLDLVLEELEGRRALLDGVEGRSTLRAEYARALVTLGRLVRVEQVDATHVGRATDVDDAGRLVVEVEGSSRVFDAGDVVHLRPAELER